MADKYDGITRVIRIASDSSTSCPICSHHFSFDDMMFQLQVNHFLQEHDFRLLHVGQETGRDHKGDETDITVAVVGQ